MPELLFAWLVGTGAFAAMFLGMLAIGYALRMIIPIDRWTSPLKYPSFESGEDVAASFVVGFCATMFIVIPLVLGAAILA